MFAPMRPRPIIASCMAAVSHARVEKKKPGWIARGPRRF
jgi:hypothetical protein